MTSDTPEIEGNLLTGGAGWLASRRLMHLLPTATVKRVVVYLDRDNIAFISTVPQWWARIIQRGNRAGLRDVLRRILHFAGVCSGPCLLGSLRAALLLGSECEAALCSMIRP